MIFPGTEIFTSNHGWRKVEALHEEDLLESIEGGEGRVIEVEAKRVRTDLVALIAKDSGGSVTIVCDRYQEILISAGVEGATRDRWIKAEDVKAWKPDSAEGSPTPDSSWPAHNLGYMVCIPWAYLCSSDVPGRDVFYSIWAIEMKPRQSRTFRQNRKPGKGYIKPAPQRYDPVREAQMTKLCASDIKKGLFLVKGGLSLLRGETVTSTDGRTQVTGTYWGQNWLAHGLELLEKWVRYLPSKEETTRVRFWIRHGKKALESAKGK